MLSEMGMQSLWEFIVLDEVLFFMMWCRHLGTSLTCVCYFCKNMIKIKYFLSDLAKTKKRSCAAPFPYPILEHDTLNAKTVN